ncbi:hypothetical protein SPRG_10377 [Saprolegnia parasitica CBS 223.65]|uniref:Rieske domain-containing protein n=1 Tax=Saprolegnia parasitica (strain CBS 223.65) TaxID=695850 RepID=A0A067CBW7_SAPPC|nr:hypothetical protein SPRG_10377 [Saprolegnia parasitica CBS 223.65]KDO24302.1 hypothetical protein SPRG_10377 [Saprolegnia parasitica CBS 223.65]|eukprot:XP_012204899.1 hypothetical protein SPRG_10377 [Saprolegnia parasitica CBS 223.65]
MAECIVLPTGRTVLLVHHAHVLYCIDQACYHHGGPLLTGDIEEIGGKVAISCPWHNYKIALENGEGLYMGLDAANMRGDPVLKSKGVKQRTHPVEVRPDGLIYVADAMELATKAIASDEYAYKKQIIPTDVDETGLVKLHSRMS